MIQHNIYIGMNDKDTLKQELSEKQFINTISTLIGDCTIQNGLTGIFTNKDGMKTIEKSLCVMTYGRKTKDIKKIINDLKAQLNQEMIILEIKKSNAIFI